MALRRSSSFTGTEVHPDSRSWPTVAGAGCEAVEVMAPTYRRPPCCCPRTGVWHCVRRAAAVVPDDDHDPGRHRGAHRADQQRPRSGRAAATTRSSPRPGRPRAPPAPHRPPSRACPRRRPRRSAARSPPCASKARCSSRARWPTPLTVTAERGFGNGGRIAGVTVDGSPATIEWDAGRPFVLSSGGALVLDPVHRRADPRRAAPRPRRRGAHLRRPAPTTSTRRSPSAPPAWPGARESVVFDAIDGLHVRAPRRRGARPRPGASPGTCSGPGVVHLEGTLELTDASGTRAVTRLDAAEGAFDLILTPARRRRVDGGRSARGRRHRLLTGRLRPVPSLLHGRARGDVARRHRRRRPPTRPGTTTRFDDSGWEAVAVPGHWRSTAAFADTDGPLLYRRSFDAMGPAEGRRAWLTFDGLFYQGDVWLDGVLPRRHRGLLRPAHLRGHRRAAGPRRAPPRRRGHLRARSTTSPPSGTSPASSSTGTASTPTGTRAASGDRCASTETGPVRIARLRALCREATPERAVLVLRATLDSDAAAHGVGAHARSAGSTTSADQPLAAGANDVEWTMTIERPALWWPRALGDADAPRPHVGVVLDAERGRRAVRRPPPPHRAAPGAPAIVDRQRQRRAPLPQGLEPRARPGWRSPRPRPTSSRATSSWRATPGSTCCASTPTSPGPSCTTRPTRPACCCGRTSRCSGATPAASASRPCGRPTAAVDLLGHHPSIAIWCGHNEPMAIENDPTMWGDPKALRRMALQAAAAQELPDLEQDRARPVGEAGAREGRRHPARDRPLRRAPPPAAARRHRQPPLLRLVPRPRARLPRLPPRHAPHGPVRHRVRRAGGARPAPTSASRSAGPTSTGSGSDAPTRCSERCSTGTCRPPTTPPSTTWRAATQAYQAAVVRRHIEALRRIKYRPTGGFAQFCFADGHPAVTWSVLGHDRAPKAGLRRAARGVPAGDRRRRPAARARSRAGPGARARRARGERPARARSTTPRSRPASRWTGGSRTWRWQRRRPGRRRASGSAPCRSSCPTRRGRSRSSSTCRHDGEQVGQPLRGHDRLTPRPDLGLGGFQTVWDPGVGSAVDGDDDGQRPGRPPTAPIHPRPARRAPWPVEFYRSAVGKKWVMAITGIVLIGFVFVHMVGNLKVYLGRRGLQPLRRVPARAPRARSSPAPCSCGSCGSA